MLITNFTYEESHWAGIVVNGTITYNDTPL